MNIEKLVETVNKLQESLADTGCVTTLQLPQIVLVGDQGCGKSSVLEGIMGESLLPDKRSTRRPLVIQFINSDKDIDKDDEWVEFVHRPNKVFRDFEAVSEEIDLETDRMSGRNKCICTVPILIKYHTNRFLNFTIVDLPGLTRIRVGDQPADIENIVKKHVMKYMRYQNSIILTVVAANTDIETSEIVQLARLADPSGYRTMCILTKLDLMDSGTNATKVLQGKILHFKLGIIGVICRSQKELEKGTTIRNNEIKEKSFLELNYSPIAGKHGCPYLRETIHKIMIKHIKSILPEVKERIHDELESYNDSLCPFDSSGIDSQESLLCFLTRFVTSFSEFVSGTCKYIGTYELEGGARIGYIFQDVFTRALNSINPMEGFDDAAILTALRNASGTKPSLFVPQHCFEQIVKKQILNLIEPSVCCVSLVQEELVRMSYDCDRELSQQLDRFPKLRQKIYQSLASLVRSRQQETTEMVINLIKMHTAYINTAHPDFLSETDKYRIMFDILSNSKQGDLRDAVPMFSIKNENCDEIGIILNSQPNECNLIENMVTSYFNIIRKSVADAVPKIIMHFMVNYTSDHLLTELVASIYSDEDPKNFLQESPLITTQRQKLISTVESLTKANHMIREFLDL